MSEELRKQDWSPRRRAERLAMGDYGVPTAAEAKRYWKKGRVKRVLSHEARYLFGLEEHWTETKGGYPAVVSADPDGQGSYIVAFRISPDTGQIQAIQGYGR